MKNEEEQWKTNENDIQGVSPQEADSSEAREQRHAEGKGET